MVMGRKNTSMTDDATMTRAAIDEEGLKPGAHAIAGMATATPCARPCASCPWLRHNHGQAPDPHKFYTPANARRLWRGIAAGTPMTCHPTDPRMNEWDGFTVTPGHTRLCIGALALVKRSLDAFERAAVHVDQEGRGRALTLYRQGVGARMTRGGLASWAWSIMTANSPIGVPVPRVLEGIEDVGVPWDDDVLNGVRDRGPC